MNSLLMASYNDISTVPFWKGLESGAPYEGYRPSCLEPGVTNVMPKWNSPRPTQMVQIANRQVAEVHALPELPMPYAAVYHTWNEDPYGGGWHEWKANYRLDEIMCRMRKPVPRHDIHIVGEAYSYGQGWVEGALGYGRIHAPGLLRVEASRVAEEGLRALPNPCPGCGSLEGCIECKGRDCAKALDAATPSCLQSGGSRAESST